MEGQVQKIEKVLEQELEKALEHASEQIFNHSSDQIELFMEKLRQNAISILNSRLATERNQREEMEDRISKSNSALASIGGLQREVNKAG